MMRLVLPSKHRLLWVTNNNRSLLPQLAVQLFRPRQIKRLVSTNTTPNENHNTDQLRKTVSHNFPDFIEFWDRNLFYKVGYGLNTVTAMSVMIPIATLSSSILNPITFVPAAIIGGITTLYWKVGIYDMKQTSHALLRNYPVLAHVRYILETIRPEIRQYFIESDVEGKPYNRLHRAQIYQRAKGVDDTLPFGTRRNVYDVNYEWACHSMWPSQNNIIDDNKRHIIGTTTFGTTQPYNASVFNISGMSYGAISDNAIIALNTGAKIGNFYHNTGEGGVSKFHLQGQGDIVWNVGTGYFGCGSGNGEKRIFEPTVMKEMLHEAAGRIKMIEIKLSQGAKPGHGGLLPKAKITAEIAATRKLPFPPLGDCHSPSRHSSFNNVYELIHFLNQVREITGGIPVGIKLCVGNPNEIIAVGKAIIDIGIGPDFITVDGGEGGTGAAPPEFSNSVGFPLEEGLVTVRNILIGAGLKDKIVINASGHIATGFGIVRTLALGADVTSAARAFMLSLGCIQALKCNTNKCPTGIATLDKKLMYGLDPFEKSIRVANFQKKTLDAAAGIVGAIGKNNFSDITPDDIMRRVTTSKVQTLHEHFPSPEPGSLLNGTGPERLQNLWDTCDPRASKHPTTWMH